MTDFSWKSLMGMPAQAMAAQSPAPPKSDNRLFNALMSVHSAIDPVTAFGGYGNMAAMALPVGIPKVTRGPLAVAMRLKDGKVLTGAKGEMHSDVYMRHRDRVKNQAFDYEDGFVAPDGRFLSRKEAADYVNQPGELHSLGRVRKDSVNLP